MCCMGINRNIVECKDSSGEQETWLYCVLIETLWNVKKQLSIFAMVSAWGINRNIVECKDDCKITG